MAPLAAGPADYSEVKDTDTFIYTGSYYIFFFLIGGGLGQLKPYKSRGERMKKGVGL